LAYLLLSILSAFWPAKTHFRLQSSFGFKLTSRIVVWSPPQWGHSDAWPVRTLQSLSGKNARMHRERM